MEFLCLVAPSLIWTGWLFFQKKKHPLDGLYALLAGLMIFGLVAPGFFEFPYDGYLWIYSLASSLAGLACGIVYRKSSDRKKTAALSMIALLAVVWIEKLIFYTLDATSIEAIYYAQMDMASLFEQTARIFNPPLYFLLLKGWISIFGTGILSLAIFGGAPFLLFLGVSVAWIRRNAPVSTWLYVFLVCLLPISMSSAYRLWGSTFAALLCVLALWVTWNKGSRISLTSMLGGFALSLLACGFHYGAIIPGIALAVQACFMAWKEKKVLVLLGIAWILILCGITMRAVMALPSLPVSASMVERMEEMNGFLFFVSIFSGWPWGQWPFLFNVLSILFILVMLLGKGRKEEGFPWLFTLFTLAALITLGMPFIVRRWPHLFAGLPIENASFIVIDRMVWIGFALMCWLVWKKKAIVGIVSTMALAICLFAAWGLVRSSQIMWNDTRFGTAYMDRFAAKGYEFIMSNDRGTIEYPTTDEQALMSWYAPDDRTMEYAGESISRLDFDGHDYFLLSSEQLRTGIKRIMDDEGIDWQPRGIIYLGGEDFYVYTITR